jgi:16S rRNA (guanine966-N2)-methyltransferase
MRPGPPHEVRIIGGLWKRSKLPVVDAPGLRPTPDRVRETLFNWLGQDLAGWRCLDAYAGSGALGFEAASRGAAGVVLVDRDPKLVRSLRASRERLGASQVTVEQADAIAYMRRAPAAAFDIVFLDPPFAQGLSEPALAAAGRLVVPGGFIYLEAEEALDEVIPASPALVLQRRGRAGAVRFHLLQRSRADESC